MASILCSLLRADWGWGYAKRCIVYARLVTSTDGGLSTVIISVVGHQTTLKATPAVDMKKCLVHHTTILYDEATIAMARTYIAVDTRY